MGATKQTLGGYTFSWNPDKFTPPIADKTIAVCDTWDSVEILDWGNSIVGKEILLEWVFMEVAQFNQLNTLYQGQASVVWNPQTGGATFNVYIVDLKHEYFDVVDYDKPYRQNVKMLLKILSQV